MLLAEELNILKQDFLNKKESKLNYFLKYKFDKKVNKLYNLCVSLSKKSAKKGFSKKTLRVSILRWFDYSFYPIDMYIGLSDLSIDVIEFVKKRLEDQNIKISIYNDIVDITSYKIILEW